ncbi:MAG: hypothetical protein CMP61_01100 [Flavobacteriales bacterium]|nr:hypothetical protein [Flavobacteriales bacterium]|tara:strand:+ start:8627 stop:9193 length:567 start_codon:yes stop_codon:yes gene_type:complete
MNNNTLLTAIRQGNSSEFIEEIYLYYPVVKSYIIKNSGDEDEAKDVFQEAMVIFYEQAKKPTFELTCQANTYVHAIAKNLWRSRLRDRGKKIGSKVENIIDTEEEVEAYQEEEKLYGYLDNIILQLSEKCQAVFKHFYFLKKSMREIARDLNFSSENAAKTQKYKCIERAKKLAVVIQKNVEPKNYKS